MEPSLRYRGDIHVPLARPIAVLPARQGEPHDAPAEELPLTLQPEHVLARSEQRWHPTPDRAAGLLLGHRIGEVFACTAPDPASAPGLPRASADAPPTPPGPWTREAAILGELALRGPVTPRRFAAALLGTLHDPDQPSLALLQACRATGNWREAGTHSPGPGAAMRVLPLAILLGDDATALVAESIAASILTHRDIRSVAAAITAAWAAREALGLPGPAATRPLHVLECLAARCRSAERVLIRRCGDLLAPTWREHQHTLSTLLFRMAATPAPAEEVVPRLHADLLRENDPSTSEGAAAIDTTLGLAAALLVAFEGPPELCDLLGRARALPVSPAVVCTLVGALGGALRGRDLLSPTSIRGISGSDRTATLARALARDPTAIRETRM